MEKNLSNKKIVMTGATSGLGKVAAKDFIENGATLIVLYRNKEKLIELKKELSDNGVVVGILCDLNSSASVKNACDEIKKSYDRLDVLINNAGLWSFDFQESADKIEKTFHVNVLSPYILIKELKGLLLKSNSPKVITTASGLHQGSINFEDIEYRENYSGYKTYRQSKLAVILLTRLFAKRESEIVYVTQHPGLVSTGLVRDGNWFAKMFFKIFGKSPKEGAKTLQYLVKNPSENLKTGEYYANEKVKKTSTKESNNLELAKKLENEVEHYIDSKLQHVNLK